MKENIAVIILAAGASTRMGEIKQLLPWGDTCLLDHAIQQAKIVSDNVFLILGANSEIIKTSMTNSVEVIENPNWKLGMGTSISVGIAHLKKVSSFDALLIILADQPLLKAPYLLQLKKTFLSSNSKIVATSYHSKNGVPAVFDKTLFSELLTLNKDYGARKLMEKYVDELESIQPDGKALDIDTPEAYLQLLNQTKNEN